MTTEAPPPPADEAEGEGAPAAAGSKMGRPSKLTPEVVAKVEEGLGVGLSPELACERAGITRRTYALWKAKGERDEADGTESDERDFFHRVTRARAEFAFDAAKWLKDTRDKPSKGLSPENVRYMLDRRYPEDFPRTEAVELTGKGGGPVQIQTLEDAIALHGAGAARRDDKPGA